MGNWPGVQRRDFRGKTCELRPEGQVAVSKVDVAGERSSAPCFGSSEVFPEWQDCKLGGME